MGHATNESTTGRWSLIGLAMVCAMVCAVLLAGCSSSADRSTKVSTTTRPVSSSTTAATTTTTAPLKTYQVKRGDRLTTIAARYGVSIAAIVFVNRLADPDRLADGQVLKIPPHPSLALLIAPSKGRAGESFQLSLVGAKAAEVIRFEIRSPSGKHLGPPHTASADGSVTTKYQTDSDSATGRYTVIASGNKGAKTQAAFLVAAGP